MKSRMIHDTRRFTCLSYGNGLAYALEHAATLQPFVLGEVP